MWPTPKRNDEQDHSFAGLLLLLQSPSRHDLLGTTNCTALDACSLLMYCVVRSIAFTRLVSSFRGCIAVLTTHPLLLWCLPVVPQNLSCKFDWVVLPLFLRVVRMHIISNAISHPSARNKPTWKTPNTWHSYSHLSCWYVYEVSSRAGAWPSLALQTPMDHPTTNQIRFISNNRKCRLRKRQIKRALVGERDG